MKNHNSWSHLLFWSKSGPYSVEKFRCLTRKVEKKYHQPTLSYFSSHQCWDDSRILEEFFIIIDNSNSPFGQWLFFRRWCIHDCKVHPQLGAVFGFFERIHLTCLHHPGVTSPRWSHPASWLELEHEPHSCHWKKI